MAVTARARKYICGPPLYTSEGWIALDTFLEKIVTKKKTVVDYLITVLLFIAALLVFIAGALFLAGFGIAIGFGAFYGAWYLSTMRNTEYEYSVTNGDLDVDAIYGQRKRKRLLSVHSKNFELFAPINKNHEQEYLRNKTNRNLTVVDARSSDAAENAYFCVFNKDKGRFMLLFEPDERMIESFKSFNPRAVKEN